MPPSAGCLFLERKNVTRFYVTPRNRKSAPRVFACLALAAAVGFSLVPVIAIAHHHEGPISFAEKPVEPLDSDFEADCALCGQLNLNDGRSLKGPSALGLAPAQGVGATLTFANLALPAILDRARSIRGPPANA